MMTTALPEMC